MNSLAADSGCSRSWLAAATKRDRVALARSAWASASSNSSVRSITRASSVSFARLSAVDRGPLGGDVGEAHHEAPVGHLLGEDIQDQRRRPAARSKDSGARGSAPSTQSISRAAVMPSPKAISSREALQQVVEARPPAAAAPPACDSSAPSRSVPADQPARRVEDADALVDVVQRRADHPRLIVQQPAAFLPLQPDDLGHVGLQDHRAAIGGAMLAHLHPMVAARMRTLKITWRSWCRRIGAAPPRLPASRPRAVPDSATG